MRRASEPRTRRRGTQRGSCTLTSERWRSSLDRDEFTDRVRAIGDLLAAGECYQVNLTRRLTCDRPVDPVALFAVLRGREPGALRRARTARRHRGGLGFAGVLPPLGRFPRGNPAGQGNRADCRRARIQRQGSGRERHDRRPRPQRSRARERAGFGRRSRSVPRRGTPGPVPPRQHGARPSTRRTSDPPICCGPRFRPRR